MRIDKWLKVSRLIKRREVAKELCDDGDVLINGKQAKPSTEINPGDSMVLIMGRHKISINVLESRPFAKKDEAKGMYEIISDEIQEERK